LSQDVTHVNPPFFFLRAMFWFLHQICVLSTIATKYITKNQKNLQFLVIFYAKHSYQFWILVPINRNIDRFIGDIDRFISKTGFCLPQIWKKWILNLILTDIYGFCDICRNRWPSIFGVISILWSLGGRSGADMCACIFFYFSCKKKEWLIIEVITSLAYVNNF
jgi:hypothetical protein